MYKSCIRPVLLYGAQVWSPAALSYIKTLQWLQNKALKIIYNLPSDYPIKELHISANIPLISTVFQQLLDNYNTEDHNNPLVALTSAYNETTIPYAPKIRFPLTMTKASPS